MFTLNMNKQSASYATAATKTNHAKTPAALVPVKSSALVLKMPTFTKASVFAISMVAALIVTFGLVLALQPSLAYADTVQKRSNPNSSAAVSSLSAQVPASTAQEAIANHQHVVDLADILTADEEKALSKTIEEMIARYNCDFVVFTNNSTHGYSRQVFAADFYEQNGYGIGSDCSGQVMYICMESGNRGWYTAATGAARDMMTSDTVNHVDDAIEPLMKNYSFGAALTLYLEQWDAIYANNGKVPKEAADYAMMAILALVPGLLVGWFSWYSKKRKMKTIALATSATPYLVHQGVTLTKSTDTFAGISIIRTPRIQQNGGGGRSGFSGGFSSSGGGSFSGGGRSF